MYSECIYRMEAHSMRAFEAAEQLASVDLNALVLDRMYSEYIQQKLRCDLRLSATLQYPVGAFPTQRNAETRPIVYQKMRNLRLILDITLASSAMAGGGAESWKSCCK